MRCAFNTRTHLKEFLVILSSCLACKIFARIGLYSSTKFFSKPQIKLDAFGAIGEDGVFRRFKKRKTISPLNVDVDDR